MAILYIIPLSFIQTLLVHARAQERSVTCFFRKKIYGKSWISFKELLINYFAMIFCVYISTVYKSGPMRFRDDLSFHEEMIRICFLQFHSGRETSESDAGTWHESPASKTKTQNPINIFGIFEDFQF